MSFATDVPGNKFVVVLDGKLEPEPGLDCGRTHVRSVATS